MIVSSDLTAGVIIGSAFLALLGLAELWSRKFNGTPERTRKFVHMGGGLLCLSFPWAITSPWYVLGLAVLNALIIIIGRRANLLQCLHRVDRVTSGSEYYPVSIFLLFLVTYGQPWLYVSSVLVLAVADAFAALIGGRYGSIRYSVEDSEKSLEGSIAFMVIAFLAMHLPMLLLTDMPRATSVLAALLVAALVTGFEAISLKGTDNIFVPLGVAVILAKITTQPPAEIVYQNLSLAGIALVVSLMVWRLRSFNVGGTIVFLLFAYGAWSLGSELWALPVLAGFGIYMGLWFFFPGAKDRKTNVRVLTVLHALLPAIVILLIGNLYGIEGFMYGPFLASCATILSFSLWNHLVCFSTVIPERHRLPAAGLVSLAALLVAGMAPWIIISTATARHLLAVMAVAAPMGVLNELCMPRPFDGEKVWSASKISLSVLPALLLIAGQLIGVITPWHP